MSIEYKPYNKPMYYIAKQSTSGFKLVLSGKKTLESAKKNAMQLANMEDYPDYVVIKVLGKIGHK